MPAGKFFERSAVKIRFFLIYIVSVALIILVLASFWKSDASAKILPATAGTESNSSDKKLSNIDKFLHDRKGDLDKLFFATLQNTGIRGSGNSRFHSAEISFKNALDSLEVEANYLSDEEQKENVLTVLARFRNEVQNYRGLATLYSQTSKNGDIKSNHANDSLNSRLQASLAEKEVLIASLQQSLKERSAEVPKITGEEKELKQRLAKMKDAYEQLSSENKKLNVSYKIVTEDNRRLLAQLHASRK